MRRRTFLAFGAGASATAAVAVLLTTGVVTATLAILLAPPVTTPAAAADELEVFGDCEELRQWYVDTTLPHVTAWGLDGWSPLVTLDGQARGTIPLATEAAPADAGKAVGSGGTGTNVQEAGVDEPDIAKTNGTLVVRVVRDRLVVTDTEGVEPRRLGVVDLPHDTWAPELLLVDDKVLVFGGSQSGLGWSGAEFVADRTIAPYPTRSITRITTVDIGDPAAPRVERTERIEGDLLSAREYDGTVRAVLATTDPDLPFVTPTAPAATKPLAPRTAGSSGKPPSTTGFRAPTYGRPAAR